MLTSYIASNKFHHCHDVDFGPQSADLAPRPLVYDLACVQLTPGHDLTACVLLSHDTCLEVTQRQPSVVNKYQSML